MLSKEVEVDEITSTTSGLAKELQTIPALQALADIYAKTKDSSWLVKRALCIAETGCTGVVDRVYIGTKLGSTLDHMAVNGLAKLKETCPMVMKPSGELIQLGQDKTSKIVSKTSRRVLKTYPGQKFASGLNWAIDVSERILRRVTPCDGSPAKLYRNNNSPTKDRNREPAYATEDSGAYDTSEGKQTKPAPPDKAVHLKPAHRLPKGLAMRAYDMGVVLPIRTLVAILKWVRFHLGIPSKRRRSERQKMTPDKQAEIRSRKKVSPRKKVAPSFLDNLKHTAFTYIGYKGWSSRRIKLDSVTGSETVSPGRDDGEKKRKHDEILTDHGSDSESDLAHFDIDNYNSDDDPDYEPSEDSDASEEISDGETESDIEAEVIDLAKQGESPLVQIKDKLVKDNKPDEKTDVQKTKNDETTKKPVTETTTVEQKEQSKSDNTKGLPQTDLVKEQTPKDLPKKEQTQKDVAKKEQTPKDVATKEQTQKDLVKKDQPPKDQPKKESMSKDQTNKPAAQKDQPKKEAAAKKSPCPQPVVSLKPEWKTLRELEK